MTPGPGRRKCTAYRRPGPGGTPLALPLTEWLGPTWRRSCVTLPECRRKNLKGRGRGCGEGMALDLRQRRWAGAATVR